MIQGHLRVCSYLEKKIFCIQAGHIIIEMNIFLLKESLFVIFLLFQYRAWARPEAVNQTEYSLDVGVHVLTYFEEYFNISFPLPKQGNNLNNHSCDLFYITD